jgi:hypothetical protein
MTDFGVVRMIKHRSPLLTVDLLERFERFRFDDIEDRDDLEIHLSSEGRKMREQLHSR